MENNTNIQKTLEVDHTEDLVKKNNRLKKLLVGSVILLVFSLFFILLTYVSQKNRLPIEKSAQVKYEEDEGNTPTGIKYTDISKYTDIKLVNYGISNASISQENADFEDSDLSNVVYYSNDSYYLSILNKNSINKDSDLSFYLEVSNDIKNKNLTADWLTGSLWAARSPEHIVVKEINDFEYPNTDNTLAVFLLPGDYGAPEPMDDGLSIRVKIYAIKGNNIIEASYNGDAEKDLGITKAELEGCIYTKDEHSYYDTDCISKILKSEKYDAQLRAISNTLVQNFELIK